MDANVTITNNTQAFLKITGITIPEQNGGLFLNGNVTDAQDQLQITNNNSVNDPKVEVKNTYDLIDGYKLGSSWLDY